MAGEANLICIVMLLTKYVHSNRISHDVDEATGPLSRYRCSNILHSFLADR